MQELEEWLIEAYDAGEHVAWLPMSDQYREKFNSSKAWEFFYQN